MQDLILNTIRKEGNNLSTVIVSEEGYKKTLEALAVTELLEVKHRMKLEEVKEFLELYEEYGNTAIMKALQILREGY